MDDHGIFLEALAILAEELVPEEDPVLASPLYRKQLAMGLFYKVAYRNLPRQCLACVSDPDPDCGFTLKDEI